MRLKWALLRCPEYEQSLSDFRGTTVGIDHKPRMLPKIAAITRAYQCGKR